MCIRDSFHSGLCAAACSLTITTEPWPPYVFVDGEGKLSGMDVELVQAIMKEAGCTLKVATAMPPLRRMVEFQEGRIDLMLAASDTLERRAYARFTVPYRTETVGLFTSPANAARYRGLDSFEAIVAQRVSLLAPRAGWYGASYAQALSLIHI